MAALTWGSLATPAQAQTEPGGFRFSLGVTLGPGMNDFVDAVFDSVQADFAAEGFVFDLPDQRLTWPIGLTLQPYYEWDIGLGVGGSVGPFILGFIDIVGFTDTGFTFSEFERRSTFFVVPVGPDVRYTLLRRSNVAPYVRGGLRFPLAFGDIVSGGTTGRFVGGGVEFFRRKRMQLAVEIAHDNWSVDVATEHFFREVRPGGRLVSVSMVW